MVTNDNFTATIMDSDVKGKISVYMNTTIPSIYLCQNKIEGSPCSNTLGFKYSWVIPLESSHYTLEEAARAQSVRNLIINGKKAKNIILKRKVKEPKLIW